jgi:hypothetical protein
MSNFIYPIFPKGKRLNHNILKRDDQCEPCMIEYTTTTPTPTPETTPTPTPTPLPGFPITITVSEFSGLADNCNCYNGTYVINEPDIEYSEDVCPINNYVLSSSVSYGYLPWGDNYKVFFCIKTVTPEGYNSLCQRYDLNWETGAYAIDYGGGWPSSPWCDGQIELDFNII